jgi:hypothetical protein
LRIVFYANSRGRLPALDRLSDLRRRDRFGYLRTAAALLELGAQGRALGPPVSLHVADGLYELRPLCEPRVRLLYFFHEDDAVVLGPVERGGDPLPLGSLVRACRLRRRYERDPLGRSHDGAADAEEL